MVLRTQAGRDPFSGLGLPRAVEARADLPDAAVDADEKAIVKVDLGVAQDDVDTQVGVEPELRAALVLVAVPVCRSMSRRARMMDYAAPARVRRQDNPMTAPERDDDHQCGKKRCETKLGRTLQ